MQMTLTVITEDDFFLFSQNISSSIHTFHFDYPRIFFVRKEMPIILNNNMY